MPRLQIHKPNMEYALSFYRLEILFKNVPSFEVLNKHKALEIINSLDPGTCGAISVFYRMLHGVAPGNSETY